MINQQSSPLPAGETAHVTKILKNGTRLPISSSSNITSYAQISYFTLVETDGFAGVRWRLFGQVVAYADRTVLKPQRKRMPLVPAETDVE